MNITLVSDLHLEFGYQELPGGDVLILAGDIAESRSIRKSLHETKPLDRTPGYFKCWDFFEFECAKYQKVFYVMGNHEHYHGRFDKTYDELKSMMPENVTVLENEVVEYNGVMFMGATLWTDCNRGDPITVWHLKQSMNDYRVVQNHYPDKNLYHKLTPEFTYATHKKTLEYFKTVLELNRNKPFVVITHHAPSFTSVNEKYTYDKTMNGGYASELSEFILDNPNIKYWVHGHMHDPVEYNIGETRILSNPRGYVGHEDTEKFDPLFCFYL